MGAVMRIPVATLTGWALLLSLAMAEEETVTKADLTNDAAKAVIAEMQDQGYGVNDVDVESDGKEVKFKLAFSKSQPPGPFNLSASRAQLDKELRNAERRGGVLPTCLKGYRVGNNVYFAFILAVVGPEGSGSNYFARFDVPAPEFQRVVEIERSKGGKVVDQSTYVAPDGKTYHTLLFHPR